MNCQDIARILDDSELSRLTAVERARIDTHLENCADCAADWAVYARILAMPVPDMPDSLTRWRPAGSARRRVPTLVLPILLLAGAAAALLAWQSARQPDSLPDGSQQTVSASQEATATDSQPAVAPVPAATIDTGAEFAASTGDTAAEEAPLETLIVLPVNYGDAPAAAVAAIDEIYLWMMRELQSVPRLNVMVLTAADIAFVRSIPNERDQLAALFERFGVEIMLGLAVPDLSVRNSPDEQYIWGSSVNVYREPGGSRSSSSRASGGPPEPGELEKLGIDTARRVLDNLSSAVAHPYFETLFLDLGRTEADRFEAFRRLTSSMNTPTFLGLPDGAQAGPTSPAADGLSPALVNAAIELARTASDPEMRQEIWFGLSSTVQPILVRPLVDVLLYDTDEGVRRAAANILQDYRSDPVVVSVLESASSGDASAPVRAMAQWSLLEESEQPGFVSATLRDPAISPQDKAAVLQLTRGFTSPYRRQDMMRSLRREEAFPIDDDALTALVGLAESAADSWVRQTALQELGSRAHPQFLRLIRAETDNFVRRGILTQLNPRARDNAGADVAGILEQWLQFEKDADIRESIEGMLVEQEGPGPLIPQMIRPGFQQ